ncbi:formylmethanofuran dehydrogenase, subunit B [Methylobacillus rhizosphaerae]|uniref:Formylmethanofuran dehydrogenase, subunit B n=1 Tax=Methylobacillus rhizosphaerae TaxID=551994 RepID=A0A238YJX4_9PROT|nr:formylmethanofuran dehydrogenase subunit B [Methylobacillus rhizosphaerae]SNR71098.1 formylmethanofuran dehydrogenase, subunit B [Methylobacillus rhizosphaerae]
MTQSPHFPAASLEAVAHPADGLLSDDLKLDRDADGNLALTSPPCPKSKAFFEQPRSNATPAIQGQASTLDAAIAKATEIFRAARHPLLGGLATDVYGMRAVMNLAESTGATIDHMNSKSSMKNILVMQNSGWFVTTLSEVKNRVDLLLVIGTDIVSYFPRFFERVIWNQEAMFTENTAEREIVYLGGRNLDTSAGVSPNGKQPDVLPCDLDRVPEVLAALRALVAGKPLKADDVAGISRTSLEKLAERLKAAEYSVIAWTGSALDFPHAELSIQNIVGVVQELNKTTRSAGLPLSGNDGDVTAYNVSTWISGYPFRNSYRRGYPDYDPYHYDTNRLLAEGEVDALVWINSFNPERLPPKHQVPTIVIGHPSMQFEQAPDVFIPIAIPGLEANGAQFRSDSSVTLPLRKLRETKLPTLSDVLSGIESALKTA